MTPESFFHVAFKVDDVDGAAAFYETHFEGEVVERGHADEGEGATAVEHAALEVADKLVYLFDRAPYEATGDVPELPTGFLHFGFVVPDVDAAHEELTAAGVEFVTDPTTFGDLRIAFLVGPGDARVELLEHLD